MKHPHPFSRLPDRVRRVLCAVCIAAGGALLLAALSQALDSRAALQQSQDLSALYHGTLGLIAYADTPDLEEENESFGELKQINPDLVGWIKGGSMVDSPVVQRDNQFYMTHDFYGNESAAGTVFVDEINTNCDKNPYVILYGHNMKNGTMFGTLPRYRTLSHLKENPILEFTTVTSGTAGYYVPIAAFDASMDKEDENYFFLRQYSAFARTQTRLDFIKQLQERSRFSVPVEVDETDRILAPVTCSYSDPNGRFLLFCRQLRPGETQESIRAAVQGAVLK